jgi:hypothetical protein
MTKHETGRSLVGYLRTDQEAAAGTDSYGLGKALTSTDRGHWTSLVGVVIRTGFWISLITASSYLVPLCRSRDSPVTGCLRIVLGSGTHGQFHL